MIEIKVPKEIKNYKSKLFFNMSVRQCVCTGLALGICVPLYIWGKKFVSEDIVSWLVILIAAPLLMMGFFQYNDMHFEEFAKEWFSFNFTTQRRKYEYEPVFMILRNDYMAEELEQEIRQRKIDIKQNKRHRKKKNKEGEYVQQKA